MRSRLIPSVLRVAPVTSPHFQNVLFYGNQSYRQRQLSRIWKQKLLIYLTVADIFPVIDTNKSLGKVVELPISEKTINVTIHEKNARALILAKTFPPQFTPRIKNYATKTIWCREEILKY